MATGRTCPACDGPTLRRNGSRTVVVPRVTASGVAWEDLVATRLSCRSCGYASTDRDGIVAAMGRAMRRHLSDRFATHGMRAAVAESGSDPRTVGAWISAHLGEALSEPFPKTVGLRLAGRLVTVVDAGTGMALDASDRDPEALGGCLRRRGCHVDTVLVPLDPQLRAVVRETLPDAEVGLHREDGEMRLDAILGQMLTRGIPDAFLLRERVRSAEWGDRTVGVLAELARTSGIAMAALFLCEWGDEMAVGLGRPRDGPAAIMPRSGPMRVRAIISRAGCDGVDVPGIAGILSSQP